MHKVFNISCSEFEFTAMGYAYVSINRNVHVSVDLLTDSVANLSLYDSLAYCSLYEQTIYSSHKVPMM